MAGAEQSHLCSGAVEAGGSGAPCDPPAHGGARALSAPVQSVLQVTRYCLPGWDGSTKR